MASGSPSSRLHSSATSATLRSVRAKPWSTIAARWQYAATAGSRASSESSPPGSGGTGSVERTSTCSARSRRGAWLVTSTRNSGHPARISPSSGTAASRCSALSSTSRRGPWRSTPATTSGTSDPGWIGIPSAVAISDTTSSGRVTPANGTQVVQSGSASALTTSSASEVLPTPPRPVIVTSAGDPGSSMPTTRRISSSRPNTRSVGGDRWSMIMFPSHCEPRPLAGARSRRPRADAR
jgi:hypothetical protein